MISNEVKMIIAQNCFQYEPRYAISMFSMGTLSESCTNCQNFTNGKCAKGLFNQVMETISRN
ncbi:hypothetical protein [Clostridium sp. ZS2-4]|uniref:hypothetical protein n=1 Tax=Clostridium sp. ZS2-4 TaxID=2987703 RepID=UPI00227B0487|nr:hypothetical protein [Clostridium sp. ZS2-4]MCY6355994.1 hypothetical protein [Clostridium sp. ZS2-4]